jgi:phosphate starvation-inducible membrane PsiE
MKICQQDMHNYSVLLKELLLRPKDNHTEQQIA